MVYRSNKDLKKDSLQMLDNYWIAAIFVCFLVWFLASSADTFTVTGSEEIYRNGEIIRKTVEKQSGFLGVINFFFAGPITFGAAVFFMNLKRNGTAEVGDVFSGFNDFLKYFITELVKTIFIVLWTLLLVIPGIIAYYKYSMTWYILKDNPELTFMEAITESKQLMNGNKMRLLNLQLSFIGWFIVSLFTLGLGFFPLMAYYKGAEVSYYEEIIANRGITVEY